MYEDEEGRRGQLLREDYVVSFMGLLFHFYKVFDSVREEEDNGLVVGLERMSGFGEIWNK
jgi:hypothetical protein